MLFKRKKVYRISLENQDWVTPEETLLDSESQHSDIEKPIPPSIFSFFNFLVFVLGFLIIGLVFKIAIIDHEVFANLALQNRSANFPLPPPRGIIFDRHGISLVDNSPTFNILALSRELRENSDKLDDYIQKLASIFNVDSESLAISIKNQISQNSAFFIFQDITKDEAIAVDYLEPIGFYVVPDTKREYIRGQKFSQILGYTGKVGKDDLGRDDYYFMTDIIGRLGLEAKFEEYLRGKHGNIFFAKGKLGYITRQAIAGSDLHLNIDYDIQVRLFDDIFNVLKEGGISGGAGIVQNPQNGKILALVSFPSFDNNIFNSEVSEADYKKLFESKYKPLFNRAIAGLYNPGSTIKPLMAMMALQENIITPRDTINDCVSLTVPNPYNPENPYIFKNWRIEYGPFDLKRSIANSCNVYFFTVGGGSGNIKGLGAERIAKFLELSFADSMLDIDIPGEDRGFIPTPDWKLRQRGEQWYLGDTYNISIGQGDLLVTPLWINSYISAIANGGSIFKPIIVDRIIGSEGEERYVSKSEIKGRLPFSNETISYVKEAMAETVVSGTAQVLKNLPVKIGAKTGTAEVIKGTTVNSFFTLFAPYDNPEIAVTILIEGATSQQGLAVRAAYNFLDWYFNGQKNQSSEISSPSPILPTQ